jgi:hypothetical protein
MVSSFADSVFLISWKEILSHVFRRLFFSNKYIVSYLEGVCRSFLSSPKMALFQLKESNCGLSSNSGNFFDSSYLTWTTSRHLCVCGYLFYSLLLWGWRKGMETMIPFYVIHQIIENMLHVRLCGGWNRVLNFGAWFICDRPPPTFLVSVSLLLMR